MSESFPAADVSCDDEGVTLYRSAGTDHDFVHIIVDFTCFDENNDTVAIHARPEYKFIGALASDAMLVAGCDTDGADEFDDGHGNFTWMLTYPNDAERIRSIAVQLAGIASV